MSTTTAAQRTRIAYSCGHTYAPRKASDATRYYCDACLSEALCGHTVTPSPHHPIGAKGVGESATVGSPPAVVNGTAYIIGSSPTGAWAGAAGKGAAMRLASAKSS